MHNFKQKILYLFLFIFDRDFRKICRSGIFDGKYYLALNPDVARQNVDPLLHYYRLGWKEERSPNLMFDIRYYRGQSVAPDENISEPLSEFLRTGWRQGKKPNPYFDPRYYFENNQDIQWSRTNPLSHYIESGWIAGRKPCPYFESLFYIANNPDIAGDVNPLPHYIDQGGRERRRPSPAFDPHWYLDQTEALSQYSEDLLLHYFDYGIAEGKCPVPVFDPAHYKKNCRQAACAHGDWFAHYLQHGEEQGVSPCAWFDPEFYRQTYLKEKSDSPLLHFILDGVFRGYYSNRTIQTLPVKPVISILVPVFNVKAHHLNNCIRSVLYQSYPHWQLCLADDCSTEPHVRPLLQEWAERDQRIKLVFLENNQGIAGATNAAATLADGEYLGFLDNDDELAAECLYRIARTIIDTGADLLYTDEDLIGEDGRRFSVFHKPDFNPELLLCHNYVTHFVMTTRNLWQQVGGLAREKSGAQDYDLFLKLSEIAQKTVHIPEVLYHWRASETSTSINHGQKEYADEAGRQSVVDAMQRREIEAEVLNTDLRFYYRAKRELYLLPLVSLVVASDREDENCAEWVERLLRITEYENFEVIVLRQREAGSAALAAYAAVSDRPVKIIETDGRAGMAFLCNLALPTSDGEYVVLLDDALEPVDGYWLSALMEYCQRPDTGIVTGYMEMEHIAGAEVTPLPDIENRSPLYYARYVQQASVLLNGLHCPQNTWCASGICCAINRELLDGGLDADIFPHLFALHDLSFSCNNRGMHIYYTPYCRLRVGEGRHVSLSGDIAAWQSEQYVFQRKWRQVLQQGDPFYNLRKLQEAGITREDFLRWFAGV
jgi:glycosyltransferase involved in cell wall biosynthesis